MVFKDRQEAVLKILPFLEKYREQQDVVITAPPGGVSIGYYIAKNYKFPLQVILTHKLSHPSNEDIAIGAVSLENQLVNPNYTIAASYLDQEINRIRTLLREEYKRFMGERKLIDLENKIVIVSDDGIASGNTILSAIKMIRMKKPKKIIMAIPAAPLKTIKLIKMHVDKLICLHSPEEYFEPESFYSDFSELSEDHIIKLLAEANRFTEVAV